MLCIAGKNSIAVDILKFAIKELGSNSIVVIPNSDDCGEDNWQPSLKKAAIFNNIKIISLEDSYDIENLIFLSLEYNRIIKPQCFKKARLYNIHFSLLPAYKGMYTSYWPIINNEQIAGVTLHYIDDGIDTGDIIAQRKYCVTEEMTSREMYFLNLLHGTILVKKYFKNIMTGNVISTPQLSLNASYYSKRSLDYTSIEIDLKQTAYSIKKQIQSLVFREYQLPQIKGCDITHAIIQETKSQGEPGSIVIEDNLSITYNTIDYNIVVFKDCLEQLLTNCKTGNLLEVNKILDAGYNVNDQNCIGWTPLIVACYNGMQEVVKLLIKFGADVNLPSYKGITPLMYAKDFCIPHNDYSIMKLLIENGADILKKDNSNHDIFYYAQIQYFVDLLSLIEAYI